MLELFGRVHDAEQAFRGLRGRPSRRGFESVNIDLIYAAPGQTVAEWEDDLRACSTSRPITSRPTTSRSRRRRASRAGSPRDASREHPRTSSRALRGDAFVHGERGLAGYEVSNYARPGRECRHNVNYWRNGPYAGIGPSAVEQDRSRARRQRALGLPVEEDASPIAVTLSPERGARVARAPGRDVVARLAPERGRRGGSGASDRGLCGASTRRDPALGVARRLAASGHLERRSGFYRLRAEAIVLADAVAARFLNDVPRSPLACASVDGLESSCRCADPATPPAPSITFQPASAKRGGSHCRAPRHEARGRRPSSR